MNQEVAWSFGIDLDKQHEALVMAPSLPRPGNILIFNNRYRSFRGDRRSTILEVDPS